MTHAVLKQVLIKSKSFVKDHSVQIQNKCRQRISGGHVCPQRGAGDGARLYGSDRGKHGPPARDACSPGWCPKRNSGQD